jgi:putative SOS response-associated peptidase YedK
VCIYYHTESEQLIAWSEENEAWLPLEDWEQVKQHFPGYNGPILTHRPYTQKKIEVAAWGLTPRWVKDAGWGRKNANNARSETLAEKPTFRDAFARRRCIVPMSCFFERGDGVWMRYGRADGAMMMVAGLFEDPNPVSSSVTYTIATADSNSLVAEYNDRMPVILTPAQAADWLDNTTPFAYLQNYLKACPDEWLTLDASEPIVTSRKPPVQETLF